MITYSIFDKIYLKEISAEEFKILSNYHENLQAFEQTLESLVKNLSKEKKKKAENITKIFCKPARSFGLYDGEKYIGYLSFSNYESATPEIQIDIHEPYQRKGIGYKGVSFLTAELFREREDIEYFIYRVRIENVASRKLIEKLGGEEMSTDAMVAKFIKKIRITRK